MALRKLRDARHPHGAVMGGGDGFTIALWIVAFFALGAWFISLLDPFLAREVIDVVGGLFR